MSIPRRWPAVLAALIAAGPVACSTQPESGESVTERDINTVMEAHANELMAIDGVTGVAIGADDAGQPCILVLLLDESPELKRKIPVELEGFPTCLLVSGEIRPMPGSEGAGDSG